jgi:hypothetical protein
MSWISSKEPDTGTTQCHLHLTPPFASALPSSHQEQSFHFVHIEHPKKHQDSTYQIYQGKGTATMPTIDNKLVHVQAANLARRWSVQNENDLVQVRRYAFFRVKRSNTPPSFRAYLNE